MNNDTILLFLLQSSVLLAITLVLVALARRQPALRVAIGRVGLLAVLGLAIASPFIKERKHPVVPVSFAALSHSWTQRVVRSTSHIPPEKESPTVIPVFPSEPVVAITPGSFDLGLFLLPVWEIGSGLAVIWLIAGYIVLARLRRSCLPSQDSEILTEVSEIAAAFSIRTPRILEGETVSNPFVAGILCQTIFLPIGWIKTQSPDTMKAILHHEVAHIANGDLRWMLLHRLMCIALWPQLLLLVLKRPLAVAAEEICDRHVLATGIAEHRYADCLLRLREGLRSCPCPSLGIGAVSAKSALAKRIESIFDKRRPRIVRVSRTAQGLTRLGGFAVAATAVLLIAKPIPQGRIDPTANWVNVPYSGIVDIQDAHGVPVNGSKAFLVVTGDLPDQLTLDQQIVGSKVEIEPDRITSRHTTGNLLVIAKGYGANFIRLWPNPAKVTSIHLDLPISVQGQLMLASGKPAANVFVGVDSIYRMSTVEGLSGFISRGRIVLDELHTRTDENGKFTIDGLPAATGVKLDVDDPRYAVVGEDAQVTTQNQPQPGEASITYLPATIVLHPASQIRGRVTQDGHPVAGVRVDAQTNDRLNTKGTDGSGQAKTDVDGDYAIGRLSAGAYNISIQLSDAQAQRLTAVAHEGVRIAEGSSVSGLNFALIPGSVVEGTATDSLGKPVNDLYIGIYGPAHPNSSGEVQMTFTKADGKFRFHVPAGEQYVYVGDSGYKQTDETIVTEDGKVSTVKLVTKPTESQEFDPGIAQSESDAVPVAEADDSKPTAPVMSIGSGMPYYGPQRLANGAIVKLEYVQNDDTKPHTIWKPDGSKTNASDIRSSLNLKDFGRRNEKVRGMFLKVNIAGAERGDYNCLVQTPHQSNWSVWQSYGDGENRTMDLASFHAPSTLKVTDMRFGVGAGPFKTVMTAKLGQGPLVPQTFGGPRAAANVSVHFPARYEGTDARVDAYTKDERKLEIASWQDETESRGPNLRTRSYGYIGKVADIDHVALVVRPFDWVTFKGIHLYPNGN